MRKSNIYIYSLACILYFLFVLPYYSLAAYPGDCTVLTRSVSASATSYTYKANTVAVCSFPTIQDDGIFATLQCSNVYFSADNTTPVYYFGGSSPTTYVYNYYSDGGVWNIRSSAAVNGYAPGLYPKVIHFYAAAKDQILSLPTTLPETCPCQSERQELEAKCASMPPQPEGQAIASFDYETCEGTCSCPSAGTYAGELPVECVGFFCTPTALGPGATGCTPEGCEVVEAFGWPISGADWANEYNIIFDMDYTGNTCSSGTSDPVPPENDCDSWKKRCANICASGGSTVFNDTCNDEERTCECATFVAPESPPGYPPLGFCSPEEYARGELCPVDDSPDPVDPAPYNPDDSDDPPEGEPGSGDSDPDGTNDNALLGDIVDNTRQTANNTKRTGDILQNEMNILNATAKNIYSRVGTSNEWLSSIDDRLKHGLSVNVKTDPTDLSGVESRLGSIDQGIAGVNSGIDSLNTGIGTLNSTLTGIDQKLGEGFELNGDSSTPNVNTYDSSVEAVEESSFINTVTSYLSNGLPIISYLNNSYVNIVGASSSMSVNIWGKDISFDLSPLEEILDTMGIILFGVCSIVAFFIVIGRW